MRYNFSSLAMCAAGVAASLCMAACSAEDKTLVSVNGDNITKGELDAKLEASQAADQMLQSMVQQQLVFQYAKDHNITVADKDVDAKIAQIKLRLNQDQLDQALKQQGMTMQDLRDLMKEQLVVDDAIAKQVNLTNAQMQDYLNKNHALLDTPKQVRARHILVSDQATANMIEQKLKSGGDFAALAKQYSTDPGTKDKGGELGFFTQGAMVKEFSDAAFSMKPGQISAPVKSPYGWHIIQVEEIKPAVVATLANSQQKIKDDMLSAQEQIRVPEFLNSLKSSAKITVSDPQFADVAPTPMATPPSMTTPAPTPTK